MALAASIEENKQLEERLKNADGDRWRPSDRARDIARVRRATEGSRRSRRRPETLGRRFAICGNIPETERVT